MQNTLLMKGDADSLISNQINALELARTALQEAEREHDAALDERIKALEEKIQLAIQQNSSLSADLDQARALYQEKQISHDSQEKTVQDEIATFESEMEKLNKDLTTHKNANVSLDQKVIEKKIERATSKARFFSAPIGVCSIM